MSLNRQNIPFFQETRGIKLNACDRILTASLQ